MKDKIIDYIDLLETKAMQNDEYFKQRNELYIENQKLKSRIEKAVEYMQDFIFEPLLVQEDRKLIMYNENLRKFENILNGSDNNEN